MHDAEGIASRVGARVSSVSRTGDGRVLVRFAAIGETSIGTIARRVQQERLDGTALLITSAVDGSEEVELRLPHDKDLYNRAWNGAAKRTPLWLLRFATQAFATIAVGLWIHHELLDDSMATALARVQYNALTAAGMWWLDLVNYTDVHDDL